MFPVTRSDSAADMAGLTGIGRIDQHERDAGLKCLVAQKHSELIESPTVNPSTLILPSLLVNTLADARKILQSYLSRNLLSSGHNRFADFMVNLFLISALLARQSLLKLSASSSRASCTFHGFLLEGSSHRSVMGLDLLDRLAAKLLAFRGHRNIGDTKIYPQNRISPDLFRRFTLDLNIDVILRSFFAERSTCGLGTFEAIFLVVSGNQLNPLPGSEKGKADGFVLLSEGKDPGIVVDTGRLKVLDGRTVFQGGLAISCNPIDGSDGKIGGEAELRPDILVNHVVDYHAVSKVLGHVPIDPVTSIGERLQGILYLGYLFECWIQLANRGQYKFSHLRDRLHASYMNVLESAPNSSRLPKGVGLLGVLL